jgi:hypothetical protein
MIPNLVAFLLSHLGYSDPLDLTMAMHSIGFDVASDSVRDAIIANARLTRE